MPHRTLTDYAARRVMVTGHTGFKGSWLSLWLSVLGARVTGVSDNSVEAPRMFDLCRIGDLVDDRRADVRDVIAMRDLVAEVRPDVIFHLAAQPIVREALAHPFETIWVNVIGTASVLEAARWTEGVSAVVVVTSDKVYKNNSSSPPFREGDRLGGDEPYGASKAAAEVITEIYRSERFHAGAGSKSSPAVSTARAGNVIGGGDFALARIVPDAIRAIRGGRDIVLRHPGAIRPWQHVLAPLSGYLVLGLALAAGDRTISAVNFGPATGEDVTVRELAQAVIDHWGPHRTQIALQENPIGVEAGTLRVDSGFAERYLSWRPVWSTSRAILETTRWYKAWAAGTDDLREMTVAMIDAYTREGSAMGLPWIRSVR